MQTIFFEHKSYLSSLLQIIDNTRPGVITYKKEES